MKNIKPISLYVKFEYEDESKLPLIHKRSVLSETIQFKPFMDEEEKEKLATLIFGIVEEYFY